MAGQQTPTTNTPVLQPPVPNSLHFHHASASVLPVSVHTNPRLSLQAADAPRECLPPNGHQHWLNVGHSLAPHLFLGHPLQVLGIVSMHLLIRCLWASKSFWFVSFPLPSGASPAKLSISSVNCIPHPLAIVIRTIFRHTSYLPLHLHTCPSATCCKYSSFSFCFCFCIACCCTLPILMAIPATTPWQNTTHPNCRHYAFQVHTRSAPISQFAGIPAPEPLAPNALHFHPASASALPVGTHCIPRTLAVIIIAFSFLTSRHRWQLPTLRWPHRCSFWVRCAMHRVSVVPSTGSHQSAKYRVSVSP